MWFDSIENSETMALSGFVVMELIQGCQNKMQLEKLQRDLAFYETIWLEAYDCEKALDVFTQYYLSHKLLNYDIKAICENYKKKHNIYTEKLTKIKIKENATNTSS